VLLVPGFGGGDLTLAVLRCWLRRRGYVPGRARLGLNVGCSSVLVDRLEHRVAAHVHATGRPVVLVGHSRGGWLARLVAVRRPDLVAGLVMLGSPVLDPLACHPVVTRACRALVAAGRLGLRGVLDAECLEGPCRETTSAGLAAPLPMPAVAVFSRTDAVVAWQRCLDPAAEPVEVSCAHTALGADSQVYTALEPWLAARANSRR
jgi:pimeloyl-ACP methyl ester carboxylesterase